MRIGVVSDTHGHLEYTREAIRMLESLQVEQVLHCGDIGSPQIIALFEPWPTHFVFGNVDYNHAELAAEIEKQQQTCHYRFGKVELAGRRIALLHSDDAQAFQTAIHSDEWELICYGHTHVANLQRVGKTLVLNPGALYRATPHSLAIVDLGTMDVESISLV